MERAKSLDKEKDRTPHARAILVGIILFCIFVRVLWIETPVVRDEGVAGYVAMVWSRGFSPYSYPMAAENPPLVYLIYLMFLPIFGNTIIPARLINDALYVVSIVVLYLIAKDWYNEKVGLITAFFYGLFMNAPIFETQLAIPSSLSIPFIVGSVYSFSVYLRKSRKSTLFVSGLLMSFASLILQYQAVGIVLLLVMLAYYRYNAFEQSKEIRGSFIRNLINPICVLAAGVVLPFLVTVIYFWSQGALVSLIQSTVMRFLGSNYVGQHDVYAVVVLLIFLEAIPLWLFSVVGFVWCSLRKKTYDLFLVAWVAFFALIAIPVPHYGRHFSQLLPQMSLLSGVAIAPFLGETQLSSILRCLRNNVDNAEKKVASILLIVTLAVSFVPAIYFQSIQYPNTNFSLLNENVYYTFSRNWNEQQEIVNCINLHASNGELFIHGWEGELYWLSGNLAPDIRWTSSYISPGVYDITNEEYAKILRSVENGDFGTVVLMTGFRPDEIMGIVPDRYFFVKNIGLYAIYSKYNAEGYSIEYSFIENLPQALLRYSLDNGTQGNIADLNSSIYLPVVEQLTINNDSRPTIMQQTIAPLDSHAVDSEFVYDNVSISPGSQLSFGIGIDPNVWNRTKGVAFRILVQDNEGIHEIFSNYNDPTNNVEDQKWQDYLVDLSQFANKSVSIYFVTDPGPSGNNAYDWAHWSNPLLLKSH